MLKNFTLVLTLIILSTALIAQQKTVLKPLGSTVFSKTKAPEVLVNKKAKDQVTKSVNQLRLNKVQGTLDTLSYRELLGGTWNQNFGFFGQDVLVQWYQAPTDLTIKAIAFATVENANNAQISVKLYKMGWTLDELKGVGTTNWGQYPSAGDGFNNIAPFQDEATGAWVAKTEGATDPFVEDIWSDAGQGYPITPTGDGENAIYQWVEMSLLGVEPEISGGEIFAIVLTHLGTTLDGDRVGFWSRTASASSPDFYGWKFYENPRTPGDQTTTGWWSRAFTFDFVAAVDLTGDLPPVIEDITNLPTTLSTEARTVEAKITDSNPSGGTSGVQSASLQYKVNDAADWTEVAMTANGDIYSAAIPGQTPGTEVLYRIKAVDVAGNEAISLSEYSYLIFQATEPNLVVFNGFASPNQYIPYYFPESFHFDVWSYGELTADLVNNYTNIIEITTDGPNDINSDAISAWIGASASHNYVLVGDEWLGTQSNWTNQAYAAGTFQYDILGLTADSNDVNYDGSTASTQAATVLYPQQGSVLGDSLYQAVTAASEDSLLYNPYYELGISNFIDGLFVQNDVAVDVKALGLRGETFNAAIHRTLPAGNKVAFIAFDPLSIDANPDSEEDYVWYGYSTVTPLFQAIRWFGIVTAVEKEEYGKLEYKLAQNFPNPFNPETKISYTIPEKGNVKLQVFDMLGREIATLVNGYQNAGNHEINFKASNLASGLYIYKLSANNITIAKKMMLLK